MTERGPSAAVEAGVELVRWPAEADRRAQLAELGLPRLLLVPAGVKPPMPLADDEDWIRVPTDERDVWARMERLGQIRLRQRRRPELSDGAALTYGGRTVGLAPDELALLRPLVARFGQLVTWTDLVAALWPDGDGPAEAAGEAVRRLRVRIAPTRLAIHTIGRRGLVLDHPVPTDTDTDADIDADIDADSGSEGDG